MAGAFAVVLLAAVLVFAVTRPRGMPEAVATVPAAALVVVTGVVSWRHATAELQRLAGTVAFLAAVLLLAELCEIAGVFTAAGTLVVRVAQGRPRTMLAGVFAVASATTMLLSLDATVVLLTPVVVAAVAAQRLRPRPHVYACSHLANSGSLLLPVSNLTNLLAFAASGVSFGRFAALMALPQVAAIGVEYAAFRWFFAGDLAAPPTRRPAAPEPVAVPGYALAVLALTLVGFAVTSAIGVAPAWAAAAGAVALLVRVRPRLRTVVRAVNPAFVLFVLSLGIVVRAVTDHGGRHLESLVPAGSSLLALLATAFVAALAANVLNNLPAVLLLLPAAHGAGPVLAVLLGVNVGPNLTYVGSLATLLWRRVLHARDVHVPVAEFTRLGLVTVPAVLVVAVLALEASLRLVGGGS